MPTKKETNAAMSIGLAFAVCVLVAVALLLTGCDSQPCASNPKEARAQGVSCWRDEQGTTYHMETNQP